MSLCWNGTISPFRLRDRDGAVAARYGFTAIPQTAVIDNDGKVVRLFVGGGNSTAEALQKPSGDKSPPSAAQRRP